MQRLLLSATLLIILPCLANAQNTLPGAAPPTDPMDLKSAVDRASYGIGQNIAQDLRSNGLELNVELLVQGLKDGLAGTEGRFSQTELNEAFQIFSREMQRRQQEQSQAAGSKNKQEGDAFLAANQKKEGVKVLPSGLQYEVLRAGRGESPKAADTVRVHYEGRLINGTIFDSSVRRGEPAVFGVGQVIRGWTEALQLMRVGDKWRLFIPSELAYGARGAGNDIGPNSVLIFEVELLGIEQ